MATHIWWYIMWCCYYLKAGGLALSWQGHQKPITACAYTSTFFSQVKLMYLNGLVQCVHEISLQLLFYLTVFDCLSPQLSSRNAYLCIISLFPQSTLAESSAQWGSSFTFLQWKVAISVSILTLTTNDGNILKLNVVSQSTTNPNLKVTYHSRTGSLCIAVCYRMWSSW